MGVSTYKGISRGFFGVDIRTIERYIAKDGEELQSNGYTVLKGTVLKEFLDAYEMNFVTGINVGHKIRSIRLLYKKAPYWRFFFAKIRWDNSSKRF